MDDEERRPRVLSFDMGTRNLAFAWVEAPCRILRWGVIDLAKHQARVATSVLIETLETHHRWMRESGDDVVVELQPGNGVCKTLSHVLQTYFDLADRDDDEREKSRLFVFMQAGNKLKYEPEVLRRAHPQSKDDRKHVAMEMAQHIMARNDPKFEEFYRSQLYKRRTDLADALVQACRYLQIQDSSRSE